MVRELVPVVSSEAGWKKPSAQTVAPASWAKLPEGPRHVLTLVHVSDTHVCDAQSPARLPFTNRYGDPHFLEKPFVEGPVGNYRPQEMLTSQVLRQMISTINHIKGPVSGSGVELTVITGDLTDNAQENEFSWVRNLLVGGRVSPNSGSKSEFEGPGGNLFDPYYWNPDEQNESDFPKDLFGFPTIPELTMAAINSFSSPGLEMPFLAVHGNHDELLQGTVAPEPWLNDLATLEKRPTNLIQDSLFHEVVSKFSPVGPACWPTPEMMNQVSTTADPDRQFVIESSWQQHFGKPKYFSSWHAGFLFISLNTVNPHGGWDGSLDLNQLKWLEALLNENPQTPVILLSHHPLSTLNNGWAPLGSDARVTGEQFESFLSNFSNIVAWFAGHEHRNSVTRVGGANGFWLIETCSLIDWPQEGRIVEFFIRDENLLISLSMFQHDSPDSVIADQALIENLELEDTGTLASISRELSANDWQRQSGESSIHNLRGSDRDRTVVLQHPMRGLRL